LHGCKIAAAILRYDFLKWLPGRLESGKNEQD
jgi:hypothetical protein